MVNLDRSKASFTRNVRDKVKDIIWNGMRVKTVTSHSKYPGLSVMFGRSKKGNVPFSIYRVWKKLKGWKQILISSWKGSPNQGSGTIYPKLHNE